MKHPSDLIVNTAIVFIGVAVVDANVVVFIIIIITIIIIFSIVTIKNNDVSHLSYQGCYNFGKISL